MSSDGLKKFSEQLKKLRFENRVSQAQLARHVGVSSGTVAHWERAKNFPTQETVWKLCDFFKVTQDELFGKSLDLPIPDNSAQMELNLSVTDHEFAKLLAESRGVSLSEAVSHAIRFCVATSMQAQTLKPNPGLKKNGKKSNPTERNHSEEP